MEERASWRSQLKGEPCAVTDTADMFLLRESDDYQSRVRLGSALSAQYRFREAADAFRSALAIRQDDPMTWLRLGGAALTVFDFDKARDAFSQFLAWGGSEKAIAFHMGFLHYLTRDYPTAAAWFAKCLPCGDETKAAAVYWHTLSCVRAGIEPSLLEECSCRRRPDTTAPIWPLSVCSVPRPRRRPSTAPSRPAKSGNSPASSSDAGGKTGCLCL